MSVRIRSAGIQTLLLLCCAVALATDLGMEWRGQISGWTGVDRSRGETEMQMGIRYIPQAKLALPLNEEQFVDVEVALHTLALLVGDSHSTGLDLYRLTFRFATAQTATPPRLQ